MARAARRAAGVKGLTAKHAIAVVPLVSDNADVIVVGAGHNTLTTVAYLAACGLGVLLLECYGIPGGGQTSKSLTLPGFIHDTYSTAVVHLQGHPLLMYDELGLKAKFGLKFVCSGHGTVDVQTGADDFDVDVQASGAARALHFFS